MKLGSLFDGSGGFPLAGVINGIEPVWASEIEPYPLKVTAARFPHMKQLGDVRKIDGARIEKVDIITFGSPCQDLSVAGLQRGIHDGERSNLFFEAVRIIKEMRAHDRADGRTGKHIRPRFAVWENVPGAFSSNKGKDFQAVLQALCEVADPEASVPFPEGGKWSKAGCIVGDGYSIAWRTYDAQYWGVPQRRKRIYLVADFAGERAGEILFEREGMRWDSAPSREARKEAADDAEGSAGRSGGDGCVTVSIEANGQRESHKGDGYAQSDQMFTLNTVERHAVCYGIGSYDSNAMKSGNPHSGIYVADTSRTLDLNGGNPACNQGGVAVVYDCRGNGDGETAPTLTGDHQNRVTDYSALTVCRNDKITQPLGVFDFQRFGQYGNGETSSTLKARDYKDATDLVVTKPTRKYIVRRLTPLECCRLQGFPDWWEDGVEGSDSARYKMWGNGIALPCAADVLGRITREVENETTD